MLLYVIHIEDGSVKDKVDDASSVPFIPRIGEVIGIKGVVYQVKGIAHLWDMGLIKIMVSKVSKEKT